MPNWNTMAPFEIIAAPATLWIAPALTARPAINAYPLPAPTAPWAIVGTSGDLNYKNDGVTIRHSQDVTRWRALGDTGARKAFRTEEELTVGVILADVSLEQYRLALNHNTLTSVPAGADAGTKKIGLSRGPGVASFALLVRYPSPYATDLVAQLWIPIAVHIGSPEVIFRKDEPAGLDLEFEAMVNAAATDEQERFGVLEVQSAAPES